MIYCWFVRSRRFNKEIWMSEVDCRISFNHFSSKRNWKTLRNEDVYCYFISHISRIYRKFCCKKWNCIEFRCQLVKKYSSTMGATMGKNSTLLDSLPSGQVKLPHKLKLKWLTSFCCFQPLHVCLLGLDRWVLSENVWKLSFNDVLYLVLGRQPLSTD